MVNEFAQTGRNAGLDETVDALVAAAARQDDMAEGHSRRVARYALAIGERMGLSPEELQDLKHASGLHDIGKVAISRRILNKMGHLSPAEFAIMKQHSNIAIRIISKVEGLRNAAPLVKHHHERFDGKGYPDGLVGLSIPLGSRIIAVAEAFDILSTDVPWRDAMSWEDALAEISSCTGTQFDPAVAQALHQVISEGLIER